MMGRSRPGSAGTRGWHYAMLAALMFLTLPSETREAHSTPPLAMTEMPVDAPLSVMTFNVEGLPFPVRFGRDVALAQIGDRLAQLREDRRQPRIVLLQEVFSDDARQIARRAGYRHIAAGPARDDRTPDVPTPADENFDAAARAWKGEGGAKLFDSGLRILSDYPIVDIRRIAFPAYACAGYDCLANKGALLAFIAVPGHARPVAIVVTHLNSRAAAGVEIDRTSRAFKRQIDTLEQFLRTNIDPGTPLIVGGDFNVGKDADRQAYLLASVARWPRPEAAGATAAALRLCAIDRSCTQSMAPDTYRIMQRNKDLQFVSPGTADLLTPRLTAVPFGREADGSTLSDHMGYTVYYRWQTAAGGAEGTQAARSRYSQTAISS